MKLLGGTGYIAKRWGAYSDSTMASYLGNGKQHTYLNFAQEDPEVREILVEYSARPEHRSVLSTRYKERVDSLIKKEDFCVKYNSKNVASVEPVKEKSDGCIIGAFGEADDFDLYGSIVYIPKEYKFEAVQKVETGYRVVRRVTGFFTIPCEYKDFSFYIVTRKCINEKYYVEKVTPNFADSSYTYDSLLVDKEEYSKIKSSCKQF